MNPMNFAAAADLEQQITSLGIRTTLIASAVLIVFTILAALLKNRVPKLKLPLFLIMALTMVGTTVVLFGSTIYLNMKAESGGPVHWHTDIEFWACGTEINLADPHGLLSNKIGTSTYHEHNDKRIHLEGVVVRKSDDASLEKFMRVTGGFITKDSIGIPVNDFPEEWLASANNDQLDGDKQRDVNPSWFTSKLPRTGNEAVLNFKNGENCNSSPDENSETDREIQVFVYRFNKDSKTYVQEKLKNPTSYVMRDESVVPPGDCVIVEFDTPKDTTDKLCKQYGVRDAERCTEFGVEEYDPELCNIREVGRQL